MCDRVGMPTGEIRSSVCGVRFVADAGGGAWSIVVSPNSSLFSTSVLICGSYSAAIGLNGKRGGSETNSLMSFAVLLTLKVSISDEQTWANMLLMSRVTITDRSPPTQIVSSPKWIIPLRSSRPVRA